MSYGGPSVSFGHIITAKTKVRTRVQHDRPVYVGRAISTASHPQPSYRQFIRARRSRNSTPRAAGEMSSSVSVLRVSKTNRRSYPRGRANHAQTEATTGFLGAGVLRKRTPSYQHSLSRLPCAISLHLCARPCGGLSRVKSGLAIVFRRMQFFTVCVQN